MQKALLRGLGKATDIALLPLTEILILFNCYDRASVLSKFASFTDHIQLVCGKSPEIQALGQDIMTVLIDLNPALAEGIESMEARTTDWPNEQALVNFVKTRLAPPVRVAIKNLFLTTFKYDTDAENTILEPSVDANDMRLKLHEERISNTENALAKIDVVADTVAREVSDLKLAKAASAFSREEKNLRYDISEHLDNSL